MITHHKIISEEATQKSLRAQLTKSLPPRYYSSVEKMSESYLASYAPLLIMFVLAAGLSAVLITVSSIVGRHLRTRAKDLPYECGIRPTGDAREAFPVHFYLVAIIFVLFDIEAIFLYPWAIVYTKLNQHGAFGFVEMLVYILILVIGYIYLWKKGALDWK